MKIKYSKAGRPSKDKKAAKEMMEAMYKMHGDKIEVKISDCLTQMIITGTGTLHITTGDFE
jgi:hypothetical protein